ncbi:MAG: hypothetical protein EAZ89_17475 [Bacteroidetes bacterium]|nr:MAG: hypothetical protein EAZ89_17475 [Bacteroidota bacterium]
MTANKRLWMLLFPWLLTACAFDNDAAYEPVTKAAVILAEDSSGAKSLIHISGGQMDTAWAASLLAGASLTDMSGDGEGVWIATKEGGLFKIDAEGLVNQTFTLNNITPHFICAGLDYVMISDSSRDQVVFVRKKEGHISLRSSMGKPGFLVYKSGKFYVKEDSSRVGIYREVALARTGAVETGHRIWDMIPGSRSAIYVYGGEGTRYESQIDYNEDRISVEAVPVPYVKIRRSPYRVSRFGKEYTGYATLEGTRVSPGPPDAAQDFEADFFESLIYYRRQDSVFAWPIFIQQRTFLGRSDKKFLKSYYIPGYADE